MSKYVSSLEIRKNKFFVLFFVVFEAFFVYFCFLKAIMYFDHLNQIIALNGCIKGVYNVLKRNINIKSHYLHGLVQLLKHTTNDAIQYHCSLI